MASHPETAMRLITLLVLTFIVGCGGKYQGEHDAWEDEESAFHDEADADTDVDADADADADADENADSDSEGHNDDEQETDEGNRAEGCADVFLVSFSGHNFDFDFFDGVNPEYLEWDVLPLYMGHFWEYDLTVDTLSYADEFYNRNEDGDYLSVSEDGAAEDGLGFFQAWYDLQSVYDHCIGGYSNATRLIVVAHSHGTVWAHKIIEALPHIPVDILVDYDGVSTAWELEHGGRISDRIEYLEEQGYDVMDLFGGVHGVGLHQAAGDFEIPGVSIPGPHGMDIEDITPDNVYWNLEVRADESFSFRFLGYSLTKIYDDHENYRWDGSQDGIGTFLSTYGHSELYNLDEGAWDWIAENLNLFYGL